MRPGIALLILAVATVGSASAQTPQSQVSSQAASQASPLKRTVLQTKPLGTVPGRDGITVLAELAVGGTAPRHTHPGEEFVYVLEGTASFDMAGQGTVALKPGDAFFIPANTPHLAKNTGTIPVKLLSTYIIETGKPLAVPAP